MFANLYRTLLSLVSPFTFATIWKILFRLNASQVNERNYKTNREKQWYKIMGSSVANWPKFRPQNTKVAP
jgi:hypothetical protein